MKPDPHLSRFISSIQNERERQIWCATFFDAEGSINITTGHQLKIGFGIKVIEPIQVLQEFFGDGSYTKDKNGYHRFYYYSNTAKDFLSFVGDFLLEKHDPAKLIVDYYPPVIDRKPRTPKQIEIVRKLRDAVIWHNSEKQGSPLDWETFRKSISLL
jgi:hypothetical protein